MIDQSKLAEDILKRYPNAKININNISISPGETVSLLIGVNNSQPVIIKSHAKGVSTPKRHGAIWTAQEREDLIRSYHGGEDLFLVAQRMNRTVTALVSKLANLSIISNEKSNIICGSIKSSSLTNISKIIIEDA